MKALLFPFIAVIAAFLVGGVFVLAIGDNPIETYRLLIGSALWWPDGIGYTLFLATPLIFTGRCLGAFRADCEQGAEASLVARSPPHGRIVVGSLPASYSSALLCGGPIAARGGGPDPWLLRRASLP